MTLLALIALSIGASLARLLKKKLPRLERPWLLLLAPAPEVLGALLHLPTAFTQGLAYLLVGIAAWANRHLPGISFVLTGALLNALAVLLHGGMPVDPDALTRAGLAHYHDYLAQRGDGFHYLAPAFPLGDWIPLPGRVLSPGDLAIALGLLLTPLLQPKRENLR